MPVSVETYWAPDPILVAKELNQVADNLSSFAPALAASREVIVRDIRSHFEQEEEPGGAKWPPWSRNYQDYASRHNTGGILVQTGSMMRAVTSRRSWQVTGHEVFADTALWEVPNQKGQTNQRWAWHQEGRDRSHPVQAANEALLAQSGLGLEGEAEGNRLPARPFVGISEDAEFEIFDILDEFVDTSFQVATHPITGVTQRRIGGRFGPKF